MVKAFAKTASCGYLGTEIIRSDRAATRRGDSMHYGAQTKG